MNSTLSRRAAHVAALAALLATGAAQAHEVSWSIGIQAPVAPGVVLGTTVSNARPVLVQQAPVFVPAPVVHAPPPVVYAPAPVVYTQPQVVVAPAPVVYAPVRTAYVPPARRVVVPAPVYVAHRHHRGHGHHDRHDRWGGRWEGRSDGWRR